MEDETLDDLMHGIEALDDARPDYDKAEAYYEGDVPEVFSSIRLRRALAAHDVDFRLNFAKTPVNAVTRRLKINAITSPDEQQNEALARLWKANQLALEAPDLHCKTCMWGDGYLFVLPLYDDKDNVAGVEMFYNSPITVRAIYSEERPNEIDYIVKRWVERGALRAELLYPTHTLRWTTDKGSKGIQARDWRPWPVDAEDPESWRIDHTWDWPQIPVFHFRTGRPYGKPEHHGAYGAQNAVTKLATTHMSSVDYQGAPQRYALTETATTDTSDLEPGDWDDADFPEDANAVGTKDIGDDSSLKSGPGEMWLLRGFKGVGQFEPANPSVFLDPANWYVRALAHITDTPAHLFDITGDTPSGESLRRKEGPLVDKVEDRQKLFGAAWTEAMVFALRLLGYDDPTVDVRWAPAATVEDQTGWQTVQAKIDAGVPRRQALVETGYRQEMVDEWLSGTDDAELQRRVEILASLAGAAQALGAAATLGVVNSEQASALLSGALSDLEVLAQAQTEADS